MILVTLGGGGAILVADGCATHVEAPDVPVTSAVGAGDSTLAGAVLGLARGLDPLDVTRIAVAAVMTPGTESCRREDAERLLAQLRGDRASRPEWTRSGVP